MEQAGGTTLWSMILAAADRQAPDHREALEALLAASWRPVYFLYRHMGLGPDEATDVAQEFFTHVLESDWLKKADPKRGRFRTFLRVSARNFLADHRQRLGARKRGGGAHQLSFNFDEAEQLWEPAAVDPPERVFDRQWALDLIQGAIQQLEEEMRAKGREPLFRAVRSAFALDGPAQPPTYARIAEELDITEGEIAQFLYHARRRLREITRERVRATVETESDVDEEIRDLFAALAS